eukprot:g816.t1
MMIKTLQCTNEKLEATIDTLNRQLQDEKRKHVEAEQRFEIVETALNTMQQKERAHRSGIHRVSKFLENIREHIGHDDSEEKDMEDSQDLRGAVVFLKMQLSKTRSIVNLAYACAQKVTKKKSPKTEACCAQNVTKKSPKSMETTTATTHKKDTSKKKKSSPGTPVAGSRKTPQMSKTNGGEVLSSPAVRSLKTQLREQQARATTLENALDAIRNEQAETEGFQKMECEALRDRIEALQNTLRGDGSDAPRCESTDGGVSPRKIRVRVPEDVAKIVAGRGGQVDTFLDNEVEETSAMMCSETMTTDANATTAALSVAGEEAKDIPTTKTSVAETAVQTSPAKPVLDEEVTIIHALRSELKATKERTKAQRESLEAQLEELTAELMGKMEEDETKVSAERDRVESDRKALEERLHETESNLKIAEEEHVKMIASRDEMKSKVENANAEVSRLRDETTKRIVEETETFRANIKAQKEAWETQREALIEQLDELCDIAENQEKRIDGTGGEYQVEKAQLASELESTKVELAELRKYVVVFKSRSDHKIASLKTQIDESNADIAILDAKLLKIHRTLQEILRRGEKKTISLDRIMSALRKILESIALQRR